MPDREFQAGIHGVKMLVPGFGLRRLPAVRPGGGVSFILAWAFTNSTDCTKMPPEVQAQVKRGVCKERHFDEDVDDGGRV